ncbi:MAG TPA: metallopeptidase family protein [Propioniciclava sp.]|jgi:predicted Zn-dependent protease with MMP-like domain|uniref:metallopeptidase family protein n=1 Tax=Propioniciclava sp. TaxID=2038686 RepID=UPI002B835323|nr:metallopeptidase family protein [Propioniciclava sp.]HRL48295.1 metallopeptidase family protein [Propioniciclava sp.]HRL78928.1 metallopeptidase family protein [Propioniciclava sp.]
MTDDEFEGHVTDALDSIPASLLDLLENCVIVVEDEPPADEPDLLGVYDGVPLTERDHEYGAVLPDRIVIFKNPTLRMCQTREEVVEEVGITVVHEIAHYFGIDDARLHDLGYA